MPIEIIDSAGAVVRRSRDLRGILEHARRSPVATVTLDPARDKPGYYRVRFDFANGDMADSVWADWRVCADWLRARRSWRWSPFVVMGHPDFVRRFKREPD